MPTGGLCGRTYKRLDSHLRLNATCSEVVEKYYLRGMKGWGKRYYGMIEGAAEETGLTFVQIIHYCKT